MGVPLALTSKCPPDTFLVPPNHDTAPLARDWSAPMPMAKLQNGVSLYYEETDTGSRWSLPTSWPAATKAGARR